MKISSWNVNSLRARLDLIKVWIGEEEPDVLLLQETKVQDEFFPLDFFHTLGYYVIYWGQKAYNGVALASRSPFKEVTSHEFIGEARYLEAVTKGVRVGSVYVINGQEVGSPMYTKKLEFFDQISKHLAPYLDDFTPTVIGGDFNVAPYDEDVHDPIAWKGKILCSQPERRAFRQLLHQGWTDALWTEPGCKNPFTWWSYRAREWKQDRGLRIDMCLLSPAALDRYKGSGVSVQWRDQPKPSDHAPVWVDLDEQEEWAKG